MPVWEIKNSDNYYKNKYWKSQPLNKEGETSLFIPK